MDHIDVYIKGIYDNDVAEDLYNAVDFSAPDYVVRLLKSRVSIDADMRLKCLVLYEIARELGLTFCFIQNSSQYYRYPDDKLLNDIMTKSLDSKCTPLMAKLVKVICNHNKLLNHGSKD